ncbi:MAG: hypothetical protein J6J23_03535 [Clostridia bacterium]|nr:hypothetical protein [Clostridia bacterium]
MIPFTEKEKKRFATLLINSRLKYKFKCSEPNYIGHLEECLKLVDDGHWYASKYDIQVKSMREIYGMIKSHKMTDMDIKEFTNTMENPREQWKEEMKKHNNGGRETRDNKGQCVYQYVYREPIRYLNGNIYECRRNIIRYPKKCRSLRTWRKFYEMFPRQAEIDGWDGKTSIRMK